MAKRDSENPYSRDWRVLYRAAIYERDSCVRAKKLSDAEQAIVKRTHELCQESGTDVEVEREALDDAMYALIALRVAMEQSTRAA